ncbi:MAG: hypothetical protein APU95_01645 [Hadesarchaea archaeon YNP_N21]|nr:MAG: hypothetical protein APU95_01645 [Hadesarchaea archaeon YNP_N21]
MKVVRTRIFSILCENEPGVMMRITRVFMRRQINLDSITVGIEPTGLARIILMFRSDDFMAEFLRKALLRLVQIIDVETIDPETSIVREVALIKTHRLGEQEIPEVLHQIDKIGGRVLEFRDNSLVAEVYGDHERIQKFIDALGPKYIKEAARSGQVIVSRKME